MIQLDCLQHFLSQGIWIMQGRIQRFWKGGGPLYVGNRGWSRKKILGLRWSKKIKLTLETISFW